MDNLGTGDRLDCAATSVGTRARSPRLRAFVVSLALVMVLAACGGGSSDDDPSSEATQEPAATEEVAPAEEPAPTGEPVPAEGPQETDSPSLPQRPGVLGPAALGGGDADENPPPIFDDRIVAADIWDDELRILSAGMGFDGVIGWPDTELETIRAGGGSFYAEGCASDQPIVSGSPAALIDATYRGVADDQPDYDDGLPVVFTWPVLTSTLHPEDFLFTLNTGEQVVPNSAGMLPNYELNERNTLVVFGDFGNRGRVDEPDAEYVVSVEIVDDGTPLRFLGPDGEQSGVGLTWDGGSSPYTSGPSLVGAKLNHVGERAEGEGGAPQFDSMLMPNDEFALYGGGDYRLRMLTSGGYTPTGITGLTPDAYENHFRVHATAEDGSTVLLTEVGVDYEVAGGTLRVLGLADLGQAEGGNVTYDLCYTEDVDNQIDVILEGDEAAARSITHVEVPADGDYLPLYNPGGPGPDPFPDVRYTAPGPPDLEPVLIALDDPMRVSNQ